MLGVADEWVEHKQFMPQSEMCAAKVSIPQLEELSIEKMPDNLNNVHDEVVTNNVQTPTTETVGESSKAATEQPDCTTTNNWGEGWVQGRLRGTTMEMGDSKYFWI